MSWTVKMGRKAAVQWDDDMTILTMNEKKQTLRASILRTSATVLGLDLDRRCILETALTDQDQEVVLVLVLCVHALLARGHVCHHRAPSVQH